MRDTHIRQVGFTLIELMVVIAVIAILSAIAIPAYQGYVKESRYGVLRTNLDSLRVFIEDYQLDNGSYVDAAWTAGGSDTSIQSIYGWQPDGDNKTTNYSIDASDDGSTYDVLAQDSNDSTIWARCENRMATCCYPDTAGATASSCSGS